MDWEGNFSLGNDTTGLALLIVLRFRLVFALKPIVLTSELRSSFSLLLACTVH